MENKPTLCPAIIFSETVIRDAGSGKLSIINAFQSFYGPEFPFAAPPFIVTAAFMNLSGKLDRLKVSVELVDEKNEALTPLITGEFGSDREVVPDDVFDLSFFVPSCSFEREGVYRVLFRIGENVLGERSLPARLIPATNAMPATPAPAAASSSNTKKAATRQPVRPGRQTSVPPVDSFDRKKTKKTLTEDPASPHNRANETADASGR